MNAKVRLWHLAAIAVGVAGVAWYFQSTATPLPPNFTDGGYTSVHVEFQRMGNSPAISGSSSDPAVIAELTEVLRTGQSVAMCRCGALGSVEFRRSDGTAERVLLMPAHDDESIEFRAGKGRYRDNREWFLHAVGPLGLTPARWYSWPDG